MAWLAAILLLNQRNEPPEPMDDFSLGMIAGFIWTFLIEALFFGLLWAFGVL